MRTVCVFCGSKQGDSPTYVEAAITFGSMLGKLGLRVLYGGGTPGVMGAVSSAACDAGGSVSGIIPTILADKVQHDPRVHLTVVPDMHTRKAQMHALADAYAVLPGGIGTMEEFFEAFTWRSLDIHHKPIGLLNTLGFFEPMLTLLAQMEQKGFVHPKHRAQLLILSDPSELARALAGKA